MDDCLGHLKTKIKQWESVFHNKNNRKPSKNDLKGSEIEDVYLEYWNRKKRNEHSAVQDVWSTKFNKADESKGKNQSSRIIHQNSTQKSIFSDKLWKHSEEFNKQTRTISIKKAPAYSPIYHRASQLKEAAQLTLDEKSVKLDDEVKLIPIKVSDETEMSEKVAVNTADISEKPRWRISSSKLKFCGNRLEPTPSKLKSAEIDIEWLNKCFAKSENDFQQMDLDESLNSKVCETKSLKKWDKEIGIDGSERCIEEKEKIKNSSEKNSPDSLKSTKFTVENEFNHQIYATGSVSDCNTDVMNRKCNSDTPKSVIKDNGSSKGITRSNNHVLKPVTENKPSSVNSSEGVEVKMKVPKKRKAISKNNPEDNESEVSELPSKRKKSVTSGGNGLVSDNFVKINIQRKRYTRGPQKIKSRNLKFKAWKKKKWAANAGKCFSCGQPGHWSQNCPRKDEAVLNEEAKLESMKVNEDGEVQDTTDKIRPNLIREPIHKFDEDSCKSTLLVLPTGSGKSLCYQIPACIYAEKSRCITLVISPLVSLMDDQVKNLPSFLRMVCLHSGLTPAQRQHSLEALKSGEAHVLLMSPESLIAMHAFMRTSLPPVAFACIDEAHCLSEWSHNFRPSYLQVLKVLQRSLDVHCILGLSATVTLGTVNRISALLEVNPEDAVFGEASIPSNLQLSVSRERDKDKALIELLSHDRFQDIHSIIIYCTRRETTEQLATNIRIHLQNAQTERGKKVSVSAEQVSAYHAGMTAAQRKSAQKKFMKGKLRIIVATVAFGMGLDKADVRSVIHFDLPKTFESYTQEIGRAGRDGLPAYCHLFLQPQGKDLDELRRHIYSNGVDRHAVRKLLDRIFRPLQILPGCETTTEAENYSMEVAISIDDIVQTLDVKKENIETLLCYLELHPEKWFEILPAVNNSCTIQCYGGPKQLENLALKCKPISVAFTLSSTVKDTSKVKFNLIEVCSLMKWDSELVRKDLRNLQFGSINGVWRRTGILVEFGEASFHLRLTKPVTSDQRDNLLNFVHGIATQLQKKELRKLDSLFQAFKKFSGSSCCLSPSEVDLEASEGLKAVLCRYFRESHVNCKETLPKQEFNEDDLHREIRSFLDIHHENRFNARQVAQIFYGIGSPQFPAEVWGKVRRFWRSHLHVDFPDILAAANEEVVRFRS